MEHGPLAKDARFFRVSPTLGASTRDDFSTLTVYPDSQALSKQQQHKQKRYDFDRIPELP